MELRPWSEYPWLDMRAAEMCLTSTFDRKEIYRAARMLWQSGMADHKAADLLVSADSEAGHALGIESFVEKSLTAVEAFTKSAEPGWPGGQEL